MNKAQKDLETDIFGFGEVIHRKYPELWEKIKENWNNEFADLPVNITVKVKTNHLGQITKPFFIKEKEYDGYSIYFCGIRIQYCIMYYRNTKKP